MTQTSRRIKVGAITAAHGIKGQITIYSLLSPADILPKLSSLSNEDGSKQYQFRIMGKKKNLLIASLDGVNNRNDAERLKGIELFTDADDPALPEQSALPGLPVKTSTDEMYGTITDVFNFGAGDVVEIQKPDGSTEMIPLKEEFLTIEAHHATITPPEYLEAKEPSASDVSPEALAKGEAAPQGKSKEP